jgi:hypothetical protein
MTQRLETIECPLRREEEREVRPAAAPVVVAPTGAGAVSVVPRSVQAQNVGGCSAGSSE